MANPPKKKSILGALLDKLTPKRGDTSSSASRKQPNELAHSTAAGETQAVGETRENSTRRAAVEVADGVSADWNVGDVILDLYEVIDELGQGGMGKVYKVRHKHWNIDLAVKTPQPSLLQSSAAVENFERECETWVNLGLHPHTVSCYYVRRLGGIPCVFAEYVDGGDLKTWITSGQLYEGGPEESLKRILDIAIQFAWGLHYAHEKGLIHQDVKPANVMMTADGTAKVTDFGLAKARDVAGVTTASAESASSDSRQSILVGTGGMTPAYCSPEQANREQLSRKTDIWSWAVSVLEMFTGDVNWPSGTVAPEALKALLEMGTGDERIPVMPLKLVQSLWECFQTRPDHRPKDFSVIYTTLLSTYQETTDQQYPRSEPTPSELQAGGLNNRGVSLLDLGKQSEAEQAFDKALETDPHHPQATYNLGLLQWRSARITDEEAVRRMQDVCKSQANSTIDDLLLSRIHLERDDCESAIKVLETIKNSTENREEILSSLQQARDRLPLATRCLRTFEGSKVGVNCVSISPDGRWGLSGSGDRTVRLWELSTGHCVRSFEGHMDSVNSATFGPDGRWGLSGSEDMTLKQWDLATGKCQQTFKGHSGCVTSVAVSTNGAWVLSGGGTGGWGTGDNTLRLWDLSTGKCLWTFAGHTSDVTSVAISPDGRWGLSGSKDKSLRLWDLATGKCLRTFEGHTEIIYSVAISSDGRRALSGGLDFKLKLWDLTSGRCLRTFIGHTFAIKSISISRDGCWALSGGGYTDNRLRLWEIASGRCLRTLDGHTSGVSSVGLSADGRRALSGSDNGKLKLWELGVAVPAAYEITRPASSSETELIENKYREALELARGAADSMSFTTAASYLQSARSLPGCERRPDVMKSWAALYARLPRRNLSGRWEQIRLQGHASYVYSVSLSVDGRWGLSGSADHTLRLWDLATGECLRTFEGHQDQVISVCLSGDGQWALSGSGAFPGLYGKCKDNTLKLWEVATGRCVRTFEGHDRGVRSVCLSADNRWALSNGHENNFKLWDLATGRCLRTFEHDGIMDSISLSSDCRWALSGGDHFDQSLKLWDIASGKCVRTFEGRTGSIHLSKFSADGRWVLSSSGTGKVMLWELATGCCLRTFDHGPEVRSISLSGGGRCLVSVGSDFTMKSWNIGTGDIARSIAGNTNDMLSIAISLDGCWALSGHQDNSLRRWFLDWELGECNTVDWDVEARHYLETFLTLHTPYAADLPSGREPKEQEVTLALTRRGKPKITKENFEQLLFTLGCAGYGHLRPEGVKKKLLEMASKWTGPPPLI